MASRDTPRGVSPVLGGVCANLLWKRSKAALSYSTTCSYPIETVFGGHGGGIRVKDGFYINHRPAIHSGLTPKQTALLKKMCGLLDGDDLDTLNNILSDFSP